MNEAIFHLDGTTFIGLRLREAREGIGISAKNLADLLGITSASITNYEKGISQPTVEIQTKIANILNQPRQFFYHPVPETGFRHENIHYRDLTKNRALTRKQAAIRLKWLMEYVTVLERELKLPDLTLPMFDMPYDPGMITDDDIIGVVAEVKSAWKVENKPIHNLLNLLERNGVIIGQVKLNMPYLDGLSQWSDPLRRPFILLNADKSNFVKSRIDVIHELGHLVLHRYLDMELVAHGRLHTMVEKQAFRFTSEFLLPQEEWLRDVRKLGKPTLTSLRTVKQKWRVSIAAQIMRLEQVGEISTERKESLYKQLSNRKWKEHEPFDDAWEMERPKLFKQATEMLISKGYDATTLQSLMPLRPDNLSEVTSLPKAFFEQVPALLIEPKETFLN